MAAPHASCNGYRSGVFAEAYPRIEIPSSERLATRLGGCRHLARSKSTCHADIGEASQQVRLKPFAVNVNLIDFISGP